MDRDTTRAHLGMLVRALILGVSFTVVSLTGEKLPPLSLTVVRLALAALALLPLVWHAHEGLPSRRAFMLYSILGACQAAFFGAMFWAAHRLSALTMALLYVTVPFLTYAFGIGFGVEQPSVALLGILALGAVGALGLAWAGSNGQLVELRVGNAEKAVYFAGCLGLALYSVVSRWALSRGWVSQHAAVRTFWSVLVGAVLIGAFALVDEKPAALTHIAPPDILILIYLGVLSTGGTFWLMQRAAAVLSPAVVTAYSFAPPFVSMLLLFATDPPRISWRWLPGAALVAMAMAMLIRRDGRSSSRSSPAQQRSALANDSDHGRDAMIVVTDMQPVSESDVRVRTADGLADGYFVHPATGSHPGVLLWPDVLGLRPAFRTIGKRLAAAGYSVLVMNPHYRTTAAPIGIDMDAFQTPEGREKAFRLLSSLTPEMTMTDAAAFADYLDHQEGVDVTRKMGTLGYCVGAAMALRTAARAAERVGAVASFHGATLATAHESSPHLLIPKTRARALIAIAQSDDEKDPSGKALLRRAYDEANLPAEIEVYAGTRHGWCSLDTKVYDPVQAGLAWSRLLALFAEALA